MAMREKDIVSPQRAVEEARRHIRETQSVAVPPRYAGVGVPDYPVLDDSTQTGHPAMGSRGARSMHRATGTRRPT